MEPLTPNDPLWKVLGQTKKVEVRPNFTQNMVRLARQTPQDRGWLAQIKGWWQEQPVARIGLGLAAAAALALTTARIVLQPESTIPAQVTVTAPVPTNELTVTTEVDFPLIPEFSTEWQNLEQVGDLLAVHDTSLLTDSEINLLLY
jgi:hypothetical protein